MARLNINGSFLNVPDGLSPEQMDEVVEDFTANRASPQQTSYDQRIANVGTAINELQSGKTGPTQAGFRVLGQGLGAINDKIGEAIPETVKDVAKGVYSAARDYSSMGPAMRVGEYAMGKAGTAYGDFAKNNPGRALDLSAVGNLASVASLIVPGPRAVNYATDVARVAPEAASQALTRGVEKLATPRQVMPNSEQLADMGVKAYEAARASGEMFDAPSVSNKFVAALDYAKPRKIAGAVETDLSQALESNLGKYRQLANKPLSIDEIDIIDKDLSNLKDQAYNAGKNQLGSELGNIQNALRGSVSESASGATLAEARDMFRRKYQMEDVERIFRNAEGRPNEASIIQTGYRNLANQARKKGSGYSKEQIALMDKAAKGGLSIDALKLMSSKLIPVVAGASGNLAGAGVAYMGNLAAGAGATALQTAKANSLAKSITKGITVPAEPSRLNRAAQKLLSPKEISALPPEEAKAYLQLTYKPNATTYGVHPSDIPPAETVINAGGPRTLQLPSPGTTYAPSPRDMNAAEVTRARVQMRGGNAANPELGGGVIRPPVSQYNQIKDGLGRTKGKQFDNVTQIFLDGDMSQNAFVKYTKDKYGLSETKARSLVKELKTYGKGNQ